MNVTTTQSLKQSIAAKSVIAAVLLVLVTGGWCRAENERVEAETKQHRDQRTKPGRRAL